MIEMGVDPVADDALDRREIDDHAEIVEPFGFERDDGAAVVAMQMPAFADVIEEAMAVAETDFARSPGTWRTPTGCGLAFAGALRTPSRKRRKCEAKQPRTFL